MSPACSYSMINAEKNITSSLAQNNMSYGDTLTPSPKHIRNIKKNINNTNNIEKEKQETNE